MLREIHRPNVSYKEKGRLPRSILEVSHVCPKRLTVTLPSRPGARGAPCPEDSAGLPLTTEPLSGGRGAAGSARPAWFSQRVCGLTLVLLVKK